MALLSTRRMFAVCAALVIVAVLATGLVLFSSGSGLPGEPRAGEDFSLLDTSPTGGAAPGTGDHPVLKSSDDPLHEDRATCETERVAPSTIFLAGRVVDDVTGHPVTSYELSVCRSSWSSLREMESVPEAFFDSPGLVRVLTRTIEQPEGAFRLDLEKGGLHVLRVCADGRLDAFGPCVKIPERGGRDGLEIRMKADLVIIGRVVDDETGDPVAHAEIAREPVDTGSLLRKADGDTAASCQYRSGLDGSFVLRRLDERRYRVSAAHVDFREAFVDVEPGGEAVEIRLDRSGLRVFGTVRNDDGEPVTGIGIRFTSSIFPQGCFVKSGESGSYESALLSPGAYRVTASAPPDWKWEMFNFTSESRSIELRRGNIRVDFGPVRESVTWTGSVVGWDGLPVSRAKVTIMKPAESDSEDGRDTYRVHRCGRDGRFHFAKLAPARYDLSVDLPGRHGSGTRSLQKFFAGPGVYEENIVISGAEISGVVIDGPTGLPLGGGMHDVIAESEGDAPCRLSATIDEEGVFLLRNVPPGRCCLIAEPFGRQRERIEPFEVTAGERYTGVRITIRPTGRIHLRMVGFSDFMGSRYSLVFRQEGGDQVVFDSDENVVMKGINREWSEYQLFGEGLFGVVEGSRAAIEPDGSHDPTGEDWHHKNFLATGVWTVTLSIAGAGSTERTFTIHPDEWTAVTIGRDDLGGAEGER